MPRIYVAFSGLSQIGTDCKRISSKVNAIQSEFQRTVRQLDWDIRFASDINSTANQITRKLGQYSRTLSAYQRFISNTYDEYIQLDEYKMLSLADSVMPSFWTVPDKFVVVGPDGKPIFNITERIKDVIISGACATPTLWNLVAPISSLLYITSGIPFGNTLSFSDGSRATSTSASADWLGYEVKDGNPGITAWVGKAGAEAQNEWGYAGVNAYLGKAEAEAKTDFAFMKTENKTEYKNGEWGDTSKTTFFAAEATAGAAVSVLAADADVGVGSDMLGVEGKAEGTVGNATVEAKGKFSVSEDGVNAYAKGEAMVSAVEGKAKGTINILGLEITGKVGGYAGAVGVEGKIGVQDNKFVLEGGAAALIGGSVGVEIGFNDEGWDNFVDFITFWD